MMIPVTNVSSTAFPVWKLNNREDFKVSKIYPLPCIFYNYQDRAQCNADDYRDNTRLLFSTFLFCNFTLFRALCWMILIWYMMSAIYWNVAHMLRKFHHIFMLKHEFIWLHNIMETSPCMYHYMVQDTHESWRNTNPNVNKNSMEFVLLGTQYIYLSKCSRAHDACMTYARYQ